MEVVQKNLRNYVVIAIFIFSLLLGFSHGLGENSVFCNLEDSIMTKGLDWVSMPFLIAQKGFYRFMVYKLGGGRWDILIDGERINGFKNINLNKDRQTDLPRIVLLDNGRHSIIFHSRDRKPDLSGWKFLRIEKVTGVDKQYVDAIPKWKILNDYSKVLPVGAMFSGTYINVNIAREAAIFSANGYQYISYYDPEGHIVVGRRELNSSHFEKYWLPIKTGVVPVCPIKGVDFSLSDPHNYISMQIDGKGYIHLVYGHHNNALKYIKSAKPYDISKWNSPESFMENPIDEVKITYVQFIRLKTGKLLAMFRCGRSGNGYARLLKYNLEKEKWERLYSPFIDGGRDSSPYFWRAVVSRDGLVHLAWTWRLSKFDSLPDNPSAKTNFSGFTNRDISYAESSDNGITWTRSTSVKYTMPIYRQSDMQHEAEIIEHIPMGESFFNHYGADYDSKGNPHFTYTRWNNVIGQIPQQWHLYWDGARWRSSVVTDYKNKFLWTRRMQEGIASTYLTRPSIAISKDDKVIIISRSGEKNNCVELYISEDKSYEKWHRFVAYPGPLGGWEPQFDMDMWHSSNKLDLLLLGITDKAAIPGKRAIKNKIKQWLFGRRKTNYDYYSNDFTVNKLYVDNNLGEDVGYIMEIDYQKIRKYINGKK